MNYSNTLTNHYSIEQAPVKIGLRINLKAINRFLIISIIVSFVAYLISNNDLAVKSFILKDSRANLSELTLQNKELEAQVTAISSYQYLSQKTKELKFVPAQDAKYLPAHNQIFAKK